MTKDSIKIDLGIKRILINDGPDFIEFNPEDVAFAEKFYTLFQSFENKQLEYLERSKQIDENSIMDENGVPKNLDEGLSLLREVCEYLKGEIDNLFGEGTSKKLFGDVLSLNVFYQFFSGIVPFISETRSEKIAKYVPSQEIRKRNSKKKVMEE